MPEGKNPRIKDMTKESYTKYQSLSDNTKAFIDEYQSLTGRVLNITGGRRKASQGIGKAANVSHHNTGDAFDISNVHTQDFDYLVNTKEGLSLLNKYGLGIIDETDPDEMERTGATGAHFHIGRDSKYKAFVADRLKEYNQNGSIDRMYSYKAWVDGGNDPKSFVNHFEGDGHDHAEEKVKEQKTLPEYQPLSDPLAQREYLALDMRLAEKQIIKEAKMDEDRTFLMDKQKEVDNNMRQAGEFLQAFSNRQTDINPLARIQSQNQQQDFVPGYNYEDVQLQEFNPNRFIYQTQ